MSTVKPVGFTWADAVFEAWVYLPFSRKGFAQEFLVEGEQQLLLALDWRRGRGWKFHRGWNSGRHGGKIYYRNVERAFHQILENSIRR
jgi:hypothetical protein